MKATITFTEEYGKEIAPLILPLSNLFTLLTDLVERRFCGTISVEFNQGKMDSIKQIEYIKLPYHIKYTEIKS